MTDAVVSVLVGSLVGAVASVLSHLALWTTVLRATRARRPGRWLALSSIARVASVALTLAALALWSPWAPIGGLVGFLIGRTLVVERIADPGHERRPRRSTFVRGGGPP